MYTTAYVIVTILVVTALYFGVRYFARAIQRYSGARTVTCPETKSPVLVEVDSVHAAFTGLLGQPDLRLQSCQRWPLKQNCGQECLASLDVASEECLVRSVLAKWYADRRCVYCGNQFHEVHWSDHKPALQSPEGMLMEWNEVELKGLSKVLDTHLPVCWDCYIAQSFFNEHPELVVYRPWRSSGRGKGHSHA